MMVLIVKIHLHGLCLQLVKIVTGLPPHVISVNELDPLRDEGLLYYKKLLISGVDASSITINGTVHAGDMIFINATPKIYRSSLMHINNFANSL